MISGSCPNRRRLVLVRCRNRFHGNGQEKTSIESSVTSDTSNQRRLFRAWSSLRKKSAGITVLAAPADRACNS